MSGKTIPLESGHMFHILSVLVRPEGGSAIWGGELSFISLAKQLIKDGIQITTLENYPAICRTRDVEFRTNELRLARRGQLITLALQTIRTCIKFKPDIIYTYTGYFPETIIPAFVASIVTRKPLAVSINDDKWKSEDIMRVGELLRSRIARKQRLAGAIRRIVFHLSRRLACRFAVVCVTPSNYVAGFVKDVLGGRNVIVLGRGVEELWFNEMNVSKIYDASFAGRIDEHKGIDTLLNAWKIVCERLGNRRLLIIGSGEGLPKAKEMAEKLGIREYVTFTGYVVDPRKVHELLSSSKIFVFPSRKEGYARAVVESMATGLPCVLSDIPEFRALYEGTVRFAPLDDHVAFADAIESILNDSREFSRLEKASRTYVAALKWAEVSRRLREGLSTYLPKYYDLLDCKE